MPSASPSEPIPVARPWLPPFDDFAVAAKDIFERRYVSNFSKYALLLEERAGDALGQRVLAVSSCDVGLTLAWRALGVAGGEVIVPSFTLASTVNAITWNGLTPVFADIDPRTLCLDPAAARAALTPRTAGIAGVHMFGEPVSVEVDNLAAGAGLALVYDAAHAIGTTEGGASLAGRGDAAVFSLSGTKVVTAGEGGLAAFRDEAAAHRFRSLRGYGFMRDYNAVAPGLNGKISELNAALGYLSLAMLDGMVRRRSEIAARYREGLDGWRGLRMQPAPAAGDQRSYKDVVVLFPDAGTRAAAEEALAARHVGTKRYFLPAHTMDAYRHLASQPLPVTEDVWARALCLPIFHDLRDDQVDAVVAIVKDAVGAQPAG